MGSGTTATVHTAHQRPQPLRVTALSTQVAVGRWRPPWPLRASVGARSQDGLSGGQRRPVPPSGSATVRLASFGPGSARRFRGWAWLLPSPPTAGVPLAASVPARQSARWGGPQTRPGHSHRERRSRRRQIGHRAGAHKRRHHVLPQAAPTQLQVLPPAAASGKRSALATPRAGRPGPGRERRGAARLPGATGAVETCRAPRRPFSGRSPPVPSPTVWRDLRNRPELHFFSTGSATDPAVTARWLQRPGHLAELTCLVIVNSRKQLGLL